MTQPPRERDADLRAQMRHGPTDVARKELYRLAVEARDELFLRTRALRNLLAVIHRDGGHYTEFYGLDSSVAVALTIVPGMLDASEDWEAEHNRADAAESREAALKDLLKRYTEFPPYAEADGLPMNEAIRRHVEEYQLIQAEVLAALSTPEQREAPDGGSGG